MLMAVTLAGPAVGGILLRGQNEIARVVKRRLFQVRKQEALRTPGSPKRLLSVRGSIDLDLHRQHIGGRNVVVHGQPDLLHVVGALGPPGRLASRLDRRQQERDQYRDDGDDNQQFDQGEAPAKSKGWLPVLARHEWTSIQKRNVKNMDDGEALNIPVAMAGDTPQTHDPGFTFLTASSIFFICLRAAGGMVLNASGGMGLFRISLGMSLRGTSIILTSSWLQPRSTRRAARSGTIHGRANSLSSRDCLAFFMD